MFVPVMIAVIRMSVRAVRERSRMSLVFGTLAAIMVALGWGVPPVGADQKPSAPAGNADRISACSLLTREEVKKIVPWAPLLDQFPSQEEPIGATGSACEYPTVGIQVLSYSKSFVDAAGKQHKLEPVAGVGDEAYLRNNAGRYAELFARVGTRLLTIQKNIGPGQTFETEKPAVIQLAKALVAKLR